MTDEEKKEYRDKLVEDCMKYNHIDYDDDKDIVETMVEAIASEELMELIPNFDPYNLTARQRLLVYSFVKELYDHREKYQNGTQQLTNAVSTMLLNEKYGGSVNDRTGENNQSDHRNQGGQERTDHRGVL